MNTVLTIFDPYRKRQTTITGFANAEKCNRRAVWHFYHKHGTLEGFRQRPPANNNGLGPHTYTYKGEFVHVIEAARLCSISTNTLVLLRKNGLGSVEKIREYLEKHRNVRKQFKGPDGSLMTYRQIADKYGVSINTVIQFRKNHGTLRGFENRGHSRINPKLYPHTGLGVSKSLKQWAHYFNAPEENVKRWISNHNQTVDGFENRRIFNIKVRYKGKSATFREWATILKRPLQSVKNYYKHHRTLKGIPLKPRRGRPPKKKCARR